MRTEVYCFGSKLLTSFLFTFFYYEIKQIQKTTQNTEEELNKFLGSRQTDEE